MANLRKIQYASTKTGLGILGRVVRDSDLYYYDFVAGGNTFVATDSANTRISMPARSAPQNYIYESTTFDIETWNDDFYEWQVYDTVGKLLALSRFYITNGQIMFDDYLFGIQNNLAGVKSKTDNLPSDPASETNATANKGEIVTEVNSNEGKIDLVQSDVTAIKGRTDNLPTDPTSEANATANKGEIITEVNNNEIKIDDIDSNLGAVKAQTDKLNFDPSDNVQARVNDKGILNDPPASQIADAVLDEDITEHTGDDKLGQVIADIEGDTSEIQGKLPDNKIMGSSDGSNKDDEIGAIKIQTDLLPSDPADQSLVEAAIANAESNIRAGTETLESLKAKIEGVTDDLLDTSIPKEPEPTPQFTLRWLLWMIHYIWPKVGG